MRLVRLVTSNFVYAMGQHLPVPPGYLVEPFLITSIEQIEESIVSDEEEEVSQGIRFFCLPDKESAEKGPPNRPEEPKSTDFRDEEQYIAALQQYNDELIGYQAQKKYCEQAWQAVSDGIAFVAKIPITDDMRLEYLAIQSELEQETASEVEKQIGQEVPDVDSQ